MYDFIYDQTFPLKISKAQEITHIFHDDTVKGNGLLSIYSFNTNGQISSVVETPSRDDFSTKLYYNSNNEIDSIVISNNSQSSYQRYFYSYNKNQIISEDYLGGSKKNGSFSGNTIRCKYSHSQGRVSRNSVKRDSLPVSCTYYKEIIITELWVYGEKRGPYSIRYYYNKRDGRLLSICVYFSTDINKLNIYETYSCNMEGLIIEHKYYTNTLSKVKEQYFYNESGLLSKVKYYNQFGLLCEIKEYEYY